MFKQIRKYDSEIYIFEFDPKKYPSQISFGKVGQTEKLSNIHHTWYDKNGYHEIAKINLGFFWKNYEHLGLVMHDSGFMNGNPNAVNGVECYLDKQFNFKVEQLTLEQAKNTYKNVFWGGSLSYSLVINGKKETINADKYYHFKNKEPRTLIGQKSNGNLVLVVADGRGKNNSKGLTGDESANLMLELGCINAVNADGGGSSELILRTQNGMEVINHPSDGNERSIGTALIVFSKNSDIVWDEDKDEDKITIALDDGHGMNTPGKRTPQFKDGSFMHENEFNRTVVKYLKELLEYNNFDILEVAPTDEDTPLKVRTDLANNTIKNKFNKPVDLYLSVHANAMTGQWGNARGIETFYWKTSNEGKKLAEIVHKYLLKGTHQVNRGIKTADFHVLRETNMLAILIEAGFMDNENEAIMLMSDEFRKETAKELAMAVCEYYNVQFKDIPIKVEQPKQEEKKESSKQDDNKDWFQVNGELALTYLNENGLIDNPEGWVNKLKEAPTNALVFILFERLLKQIKGGN